MKKGNKFLLALGVLGILTSATSCKIERGKYAEGVGTIYCDDGFKNIMEEEIEVFEFQYPKSSIIPKYVSELEAVNALLGDSTESIVVTHEFTEDQIKYIRSKYNKVVKQHPIAVDAVALITNKDNPVMELSIEEVGQIMRGEVTHWNQLALADTSRINIVFDNQNSSTVMYMRDRFLDGKTFTSENRANVFAENNNLQVFDVVKRDKNALGIISVNWLGADLGFAKNVPVEIKTEDYQDGNYDIGDESLLTTEVKIIPILNPTEGNLYSTTPWLPSQYNIGKRDRYPFIRMYYMITTASSSTLMKSFYDFVTGHIGQKIILRSGIMPYDIYDRVIELQSH